MEGKFVKTIIPADRINCNGDVYSKEALKNAYDNFANMGVKTVE